MHLGLCGHILLYNDSPLLLDRKEGKEGKRNQGHTSVKILYTVVQTHHKLKVIRHSPVLVLRGKKPEKNKAHECTHK